MPVDRARDELLAGAGLALHEDGGVRRPDLLDAAQDVPDRGALPGDLGLRVRLADLGLEVIALRLEPVLQPRDLLERAPELVFALPLLGDVADHAVRFPNVVRSVAGRDARHLELPSFPPLRVQVPVLDSDLLQPPVVQLVAQLEEAGTVVGVDALEEELDLLEAVLVLRRQSEQVQQPGIEVGGALFVVHLVEPESGELGAGVETRLARAQRLFVTLSVGDVDREARQAVGLAVAFEAGSSAGVDPADKALALAVDPVLDGEGNAASPRPLDGILDEDPVFGIDGALEAGEVDGLVRRVPEDRPGPRRGPEAAGRKVERPESRLGGVRGQLQALAALAQVDLVAPAGERVGEDLGDQPQPPHDRVRPVARYRHRVEGEGADRGRAAHRERNRQVRPDAETDGALAIDGPRGRKRLDRRQDHGAPGPQLALDPGEALLADRLADCRHLRGDIDVGRRDDGRIRCRPLPEHAEVDAERLADAAQRVLDLAVHLVGREVDEARGELGDQRLETTKLLEGSRGPRRTVAGHRAGS